MKDLDRLVAIEDIKNLKARRIRAMDEKRWTDYEAMHAPDHMSDTYGGEPSIGAKNNVDRLAQVLGHVTSVHHAHTPEITITSDEDAEGVWAMEDMLYWSKEPKITGCMVLGTIMSAIAKVLRGGNSYIADLHGSISSLRWERIWPGQI